ncbi:HET-domain-containing protein [Pleurostoma richardsiae]|uniref:HET-domain-containing protein n=1 Tax=Pleurostoma richardsiae TaxID=41990 RepID=A0AA38R8B3_9PEZI|nr:HET-domain-containing protein [Pleurostoma richardsiae]
MRLINVETLQFEEFFGSDVPEYVILSHTWDDGEVMFRDWGTPDGATREGISKILKTCELAREEYKVPYAWADTCCIDKSSSAELSEAINSMFAWYRGAAFCLAYLSDLEALPLSGSVLAESRWFTRGWTLQELIAPVHVHFYDSRWNMIGTKISLARDIEAITRIPQRVLCGREDYLTVCIGGRMSWASSRQTTRVEDTAYCLLGLFRVNMPLLYGEGNRAFIRLQEEIIKTSTDLTIFAWSETQKEVSSVWATSPRQFQACPGISLRPGERVNRSELQFTVTNRGLRFDGVALTLMCMCPSPSHDAQGLQCDKPNYVLDLGAIDNQSSNHITYPGVKLDKVDHMLFLRAGQLPLDPGSHSSGYYKRTVRNTFYISTNDHSRGGPIPRSFAYRMDDLVGSAFVIRQVVPENYWDYSRQCFYCSPDPESWGAMLVAAKSRGDSVSDTSTQEKWCYVKLVSLGLLGVAIMRCEDWQSLPLSLFYDSSYASMSYFQISGLLSGSGRRWTNYWTWQRRRLISGRRDSNDVELGPDTSAATTAKEDSLV